MASIKVINLKETDSTNRFLREYHGEEGQLMTVVSAEHQTAGRGQGANSWESVRGKNLLFSVLLHPLNIPASRQFVMLEVKSLAIRDSLAELVPDISIKWPNDIYFRDMKIGGTLSECVISGKCMKNCILGTGINVNQLTFTSDAPNPISLYNILGHETDRQALLDMIIDRFVYYLKMVESSQLEDLDYLYANALYRRRGIFEYEDANGRFMADIVGVESNGSLVLQKTDGTVSKYAFKEVKYII
ncbi:MAG: biotin--[acetyl-CoA-carboxylase] ligase [Prevotella sp.]|nr:biotin--[acetyl-CoA-carboxylase] ligase [Prevotella sp.]